MAREHLLAGPAIRRLRRRHDLTQAAMATRLAISPSYLNLIERNQRPVSARVIVSLIEEFEFDPRTIREDQAVGGVDGMARRLADARFADLGIDRDEVGEFLSASPQVAAAFARLYDGAGSAALPKDDPLGESRAEIERWRNHFADLDHAAEEMADDMRLSRADIGLALTERLRERHQLSVRILPSDILVDTISRIDLHARQVQLSEMLPTASRNFQLALQIAKLEFGTQIQTHSSGARLASEGARQLFQRHLENYVAAALLMPYSRFVRACEATSYDLPILERRFGVSFEQLAHRLTTLQRVGQRGLPFFMLRIDRAGQISKKFVGASPALFIQRDVTCPLWHVHRAFDRHGELLVQSVAVDESENDNSTWLTMMRSVNQNGSQGAARFVVALGVQAKLAPDLAQARGLSLDYAAAQPVGPGCEHCARPQCVQRSLPMNSRELRIDLQRRGSSPFDYDRKDTR